MVDRKKSVVMTGGSWKSQEEITEKCSEPVAEFSIQIKV